MPVPRGAQAASSEPQRSVRRRAVLRVAIGALAAVSIISVPEVAAPAPVEAASCTGWKSKATPPVTIRVLRTRSGKVQTVNFRRYVAIVMASGEWPSRLRKATLQAGAVATKQYAWYYAMQGNHRSGYRSHGKCYDVRDDVMDQLYRPGRAKPTRKQQKAIDATWGLTLRKGGRFFLTGYRAGTSGRCGADANGWKLYARSVEACAAKGWSRRRIQDAYYEPNVAYVWSKHLGPAMKKPRVRLRTGNTVAEGAATVTWAPLSPRSKVKRYKLQHKIGKNDWKDVKLDSPKARSATVRLRTGVKNRFRVMARGTDGRRGPWAYGLRRKPVIRGPVDATISSASAPTAGSTAAGGASAMAARDTRSKVRIRFKGRAIAYVASTGPRQGRARIFLNGKRIATVDLERAKRSHGKLIWSRNFPRAKKRSVSIRAVGRQSVDFDGFYVLR